MNTSFNKTLITCAILSATTFASTAHAGNAFNKYPESKTATNSHGYQVTGDRSTHKCDTKTVTKHKHHNYVVKPLPAKPSSKLSYTSDIGTKNMSKRFNKIYTYKAPAKRTMPVLISEGAYNAR